MWQVYATVYGKMQDYIVSQVRTQAHIMRRDVVEKRDVAYQAAFLASRWPGLVEAYRQDDRQRGLAHGQELMNALGLDYLVVTDAEANIFIRVHAPDRFGDNIGNQINIQRSLRGERSAGFEDGAVVKFSIRAGAPILDSVGAVIGAVSAGFVLGNEAFVDSLKSKLGMDATIFYGDSCYQTTLSDQSGQRLMGGKLENQSILQQVLSEGKDYYGTSPLGDHNYISAFLPVRGANGKISGMFFCGDRSEVLMGTVSSISWRLLLVMGVLSLAVTIALGFLIRKAIIGPLARLVVAADEIALGRLNAAIPLGANNEVGRLGRAIARMAESLRQMVGTIDDIADELVIESEQTSTRAQQIADGIGVQASSSEQIAAAMEELASTCTANSDGAQEANALSNLVVKGIRHGSETTNNTAEYMEQIAQSSEMVSAIAAQTNILALNAAVEAARAGEYGRGFAVVAGEVRRLAERSASAAHQIEEVTGKGVVLAQSAGQELEKLVPELERAAGLIQEMMQVVGERNNGVEQVNNASQQLSEVIQANSTTSEDLAMSAKQLKEMAERLKEAVGVFQR